ncbi:MAG: hypothetical protein AAGF12_17825 [Myxococcota bacterium]
MGVLKGKQRGDLGRGSALGVVGLTVALGACTAPVEVAGYRVGAIDRPVDPPTVYSEPYPEDPLFGIAPAAQVNEGDQQAAIERIGRQLNPEANRAQVVTPVYAPTNLQTMVIGFDLRPTLPIQATD